MPPEPPFTMATRLEDGTLIITLAGELDITIRDTLAEQLSQALTPPPDQLAYDLTRVPYIDAGTLRLLLQTARRTPRKPVLVGPAPLVTRLLQTTGLDSECTTTTTQQPKAGR